MKHQYHEIAAGIIGLIVAGGTCISAPKFIASLDFSYIILAAMLAWLGGCVLYADTYGGE